MSFSYSIQNYKNNYNLNNYDTLFYLFEISIKGSDRYLIRRIKNTKEGNLISFTDNIPVNLSEIKLDIFDFNNPSNKINLKKKFEKSISNLLISNENIIISLKNDDNLLICNYKFIN